METEINISFKDKYIEVKYNGEVDIKFATKLWTNIVKACNEHNCYRVFGIATSHEPLTTMDSYDHAALFKSLGIDNKYKIAWVELEPKSVESIRLVETVLSNRWLPGKLFMNVNEAKSWLLRDIPFNK